MKTKKIANFSHSRLTWVQEAVRRIEADHCRTADTHLIRVELPRFDGINLYLKDESVHPTGSLKHRLARSLILHALCSGWIGPKTVLIEASSGSTAVSEAYYARLIGLRSIAVVPRTVARAKIEAIRAQGGDVHFVDDPLAIYDEAERLARDTGGHYLDQFTYAERATDWRGNNNIAESIFAQMEAEETPVPDWIVCGAGTGGTSATIGRYIRYGRYATQLCVADPAASVFHRHFSDRSIFSLPGTCGSIIEGIGRARVEPSFIPDLVDRMIAVPDDASIGAMRAISSRIGRRVGGSTGTNIVACMQLIAEMAGRGEQGSVVTILCDSGDRYADTYYDDAWLAERNLDWKPHEKAMSAMLATQVQALSRAPSIGVEDITSIAALKTTPAPAPQGIVPIARRA
ncbi:PLP-dependent cysteine synthase family protein [Sphingobium sp. H39-3-25]|uniref:PLP-dependent cysteine synthase family protein n=1 Tax=Sphingobium arseniciresistens TaxID=3030834 RepID=UPI0023B89671|nr:PLP-dependent cysteine synthase family protein [Sphingobium arseniciresistens]